MKAVNSVAPIKKVREGKFRTLVSNGYNLSNTKERQTLFNVKKVRLRNRQR